MTIDEAIKERQKVIEVQEKLYEEASTNESKEIIKSATDNDSQLVEWLTEYKELKNSIGAVKLKDMKEAVGLLQELNAENDQLTSQLLEAKRLLKLAVEDINLMTPFKSCSFCSFNNTNLCDPNVPCALQATWKYNDEVNEFLENGD